MKALGEKRCSSYSFSTSALDGGEWSASLPDRALAPGKEPPVSIVQEAVWASERVWTQRLEEKILSPLPGIEPRSPGCPARSQTLYWLSYLAHEDNILRCIFSQERLATKLPFEYFPIRNLIIILAFTCGTTMATKHFHFTACSASGNDLHCYSQCYSFLNKKFWEELICLLSLHKLTVNNIQCHHLHSKLHSNALIGSKVAPTSEV
jgi:hypothetical protein